MRILLASLALLLIASVPHEAQAQEYPWCAQYGWGHGGTNCGFVTLQQCQWAISGVGGYCRPNGFYRGPVYAAPRKMKKKRRVYYY
jgi:hypothetical protein